MPAPGTSRNRPYAPEELETVGGHTAILGDTTVDVYLNDRVYWKNIPLSVWEYTMCGYAVIKKWLSYREKALLGRSLTVQEARYVTDMARRVAAIMLMGPTLDENYRSST